MSNNPTSKSITGSGHLQLVAERLSAQLGLPPNEIADRLTPLATWGNLMGLSYSTTNHATQPLGTAALSALNLIHPEAVDAWSTAIRALSADLPKLASKPDAKSNPVLFLLSRTLTRPLGPFVAQSLVAGFWRKHRQVDHLSESEQRRVLAAFIAVPIHIVKLIRRGAVDRINPANPDELRELVLSEIFSIIRIKYRSRRTYWSKWNTIMYGDPSRYPFESRLSSHGRTSGYTSYEFRIAELTDDDEALIHSDQVWLDRVVEQEPQHTLNDEHTETVKVVEAAPSTKKRAFSLRRQANTEVNERNPSPYQAGVYSEEVLALILMNAQQIAEQLSPAQLLAFQCVLELAITTGRLPEFLTTIQIAEAPTESPKPTLILSEGCLQFRPAQFVGYPDDYVPPEAAGRDPINLCGGYEPVMALTAIPLRMSLIKAARALLQMGHTSIGSALPISQCKELLKRTQHAVHRTCPSAPVISGPRFTRTFEGHSAGYGLDPVYAYRISERAHAHLHMPVRYSFVWPQAFFAAYQLTTDRFTAALQESCCALQRTYALPMPSWLAESGQWANTQPADLNGSGSWRCAKLDRVRDLWWHFVLPASQCAALFKFCGLTGVRPFEAVRIRREQAAEDGSRVSIEGKSNVAHPAFRTIIVPRGFDFEVAQHKKINRTWLFEKTDGSPFAVEDLENVIKDTGIHLSWQPYDIPAVYSLRHLYRSHLLRCGVPFHVINYQMGHQSEGMNLYDPYLDCQTFDVAPLLEPAVHQLQVEFDIPF